MKLRNLSVKLIAFLTAAVMSAAALSGCSLPKTESNISDSTTGVTSGESTAASDPSGESVTVSDTSDVNAEPLDSRTLLIYMCGSNLETTFGAATKNIAEMLSVKLPDDVNIVIETGGAKKWRDYNIPADKLSRYLIKNGKLIPLSKIERTNMGYKNTFADFLEYGFETFPAKKTAVILWDHGSGCISGMISDENYSGGSLGIDEISSALTDAIQKYNANVDLISMDACLMANFETACAVKDCADYLLASEEIEPTGGWDYKALLSALAANKNASAMDIGKAACDGFYDKYSDLADRYATLSLIDLAKIDKVSGAFNDALGALLQDEIELKDIRTVADSANHACKCGAYSERTGYSNLIDMSDFAEYYGSMHGNDDFADAVSSCIAYSVTAGHGEEHDGLSFYYPLNYNDKSFEKYYNDICSVPAYKSYLKQVFENIPESTIEYKDVSVTEDGALKVEVTDESLPYILDKQYILFEIPVFNEEALEDHSKLNLFRMIGVDNDIETLNDGKTYISNFRGITLTLNGEELFYNFIGKTHDSYIFEAPIIVNGESSNLRFAFVFDENDFNNGHYEIIGLWDGIEYSTGMLDKGFQPLGPDDVVEVFDITMGSAVPDDEDNEENENDEDTIKIPKSPDGYTITEEPLKGEYYLYKFDLIDIYGRPTEQQINAIFHMTKSYDELKEHPLPDGEYAAEAVAVWVE